MNFRPDPLVDTEFDFELESAMMGRSYSLSTGKNDILPSEDTITIGTKNGEAFLGNDVLMGRLTTTDALKDRVSRDNARSGF